MVILRTRNKITDFFMILAWASPFKIFWVNLSQLMKIVSFMFRSTSTEHTSALTHLNDVSKPCAKPFFFTERAECYLQV